MVEAASSKKSKVLLCIIVCIFLATFSNTYAADPQEAQKIYTSKELVIKQTTSSSLDVPKGITNARVELAYFPHSTFRQQIVSQDSAPTPVTEDEDLTVFSWDDPYEGTHEFIVQTTVRTTNTYLPVTEKVLFPLVKAALPADVQEYLGASENIDINSEIVSQASQIASGKDDLFEISHAVASWVEQNIEYDLSTLTASVSQPASWTLQNKQGVCDELTSLFIAMMRSLGVPARFVSGMSYTNSDLFLEPWGPHAWAEVYFPEHGWVPFDLTYRQFGHIDASHVTLKVAKDADDSFTRYTWTGYGNEVSMAPLNLQTEVIEYIDTIEPSVSFTVEPLYNQIGLTSANSININLQNKENHYVTTTLQIASPVEVAMENHLNVILKPREEKTILLPLTLSELDARFVYTMPIEVTEFYGASAQASFKVASQYPSYSNTHVESQINREADSNAGKIKTECSAQPFAIAGKEFILQCFIENTGNLFYEDMEICLEDTCQDTQLGISQKISIQIEQLYNTSQEANVPLKISVGGQELFTQDIVFSVTGVPEIQLTATLPEKIEYADKKKFNLLVESASNAKPMNIRIEIFTTADPLIYSIDELDRPYQLEGSIFGNELKEGANNIKMHIMYEDLAGEQFTLEKEYTITLGELSLWQSISSSLRRFFRNAL